MPPQDRIVHSVDAGSYTFDSSIHSPERESTDLVVGRATPLISRRPEMVDATEAREIFRNYVESHGNSLDALGRPD